MTEHIAIPLGGQWEIALLLIVAVSWFVYHYLVPDRFKEWRNAGLVQAFVVALYAEMYGFPLTAYLLSRYLHLDGNWRHVEGHLWATLLGYGYVGAMVEMLLGYTLILVGISLVIQGWRQVYKAQKSGEVVTTGVYRYMRHPQYTGIFLALFGQLVHWPTIPTLVLFPLIVWLYVRLAKREENRMIQKHGMLYRDYMNNVPRFLPCKSQWESIAREL